METRREVNLLPLLVNIQDWTVRGNIALPAELLSAVPRFKELPESVALGVVS